MDPRKSVTRDLAQAVAATQLLLERLVANDSSTLTRLTTLEVTVEGIRRDLLMLSNVLRIDGNKKGLVTQFALMQNDLDDLNKWVERQEALENKLKEQEGLIKKQLADLQAALATAQLAETKRKTELWGQVGALVAALTALVVALAK